jgi:hypothetical protein
MWRNIAGFEDGDVSGVLGGAFRPEQGFFNFTFETFGTSIPETICVKTLAAWKR